MKDFLKNLPQLIEIAKNIIPILKFVPILMVLAALGYAGYLYFQKAEAHGDPFVCYEGEIYERIRFDSDVYEFRGGYCVNGKNPQSPLK